MCAGVELAQRAGVVAISREVRGVDFAIVGLDAEERRVPENDFQIGRDRGDVRLRGHPMDGRRQYLGDKRKDREAGGDRRAKARQGAARALSPPCFPPALPAQKRSHWLFHRQKSMELEGTGRSLSIRGNNERAPAP